MFAVLIHWWVEVLHADRTASMCIWTTAEPRARLLKRKTGLSAPPTPVTITDRSKAVLLQWFILRIGVTKLIGGGLLYIHSSYFYHCVLSVFYNICKEPLQNLGWRLLQRGTGLRPPVIYYWPFQCDVSVVVYSNCQCSSAFSLSLTYYSIIWNSLVAICWERAVPLVFSLVLFLF